MSDVEIISKKSFSVRDSEILDKFVEFQKALIIAFYLMFISFSKIVLGQLILVY